MHAIGTLDDLAIKEVHWRHAKKARNEFVDRALEQFFGRTLLLDIAAMHDHDPVCQSHRFDLVVGHVDHVFPNPLAHQRQFCPHLTAQFCIKV